LVWPFCGSSAAVAQSADFTLSTRKLSPTRDVASPDHDDPRS
jgi:hypothetical protein